MTRRRARFIAVQTLLTAVLMGVIVVTLINPADENALFAVDVPGTRAPTAQNPPSDRPADVGDQDGRGGDATDGAGDGLGTGQTGPDAFAPAAGTAGAAAQSPPFTQPPAPADEEATGPAGEQYGDTVARLSDAVN